MNKTELIMRRAYRKAAKKRKLKIVGLIPARGDSKGIKDKNITMLVGYPLIAHSILAMTVAEISDIYVSTDSKVIADTALLYGARVVERPARYAKDRSPTEETIRHFLSKVECDAVVMVQCTSPMLTPIYIRRAIDQFVAIRYDSLFSVVNTKSSDMLLWNRHLKPINYDPKKRSNRQMRVSYVYIETGGFYIFKKSTFLREGCRICGKFGVYEIPSNQVLEIDTEQNLNMAIRLMGKR